MAPEGNAYLPPEGRALAELELPLPPVEEQRRLSVEIEARLSGIDRLRTTIRAAQNRAAGLRRAILARAFRGELVPQDPDDEPASVLLERIAAERAAAGNATGARQRRRATIG
jgi:type I restriction enzyme S subunit